MQTFVGAYPSVCLINLLTPKSDWDQISPHRITVESNIKVFKNKRNGCKLKKLVIIEQILVFSTIGNVKGALWRM